MIQKEVTVKREEVQTSGHAEEVEGKEIAEEKDALVKEIELEKNLKHEEDLTEAMIPVDDGKKE